MKEETHFNGKFYEPVESKELTEAQTAIADIWHKAGKLSLPVFEEFMKRYYHSLVKGSDAKKWISDRKPTLEEANTDGEVLVYMPAIKNYSRASIKMVYFAHVLTNQPWHKLPNHPLLSPPAKP